jgi:hypothetical protein
MSCPVVRIKSMLHDLLFCLEISKARKLQICYVFRPVALVGDPPSMNISMSDGISLLPLAVVGDLLFVGVSMSPDQSGCWSLHVA